MDKELIFDMAKRSRQTWTSENKLKADRQLTALGVTIKARRVKLQMTQEELAEASELHRTYISDIERGKRNPTILSVIHLAQALEAIPASL